MKFLLPLLFCAAVAHAQPAGRPFILGTTVQLHSAILNEDRTLNIYLPEGYNPADTATYPVIYLLDGSRDEDFIHIVGLVMFNSFPWVGRLQTSIVVGIANIDRKRDFTFPTTVAADLAAYPTTGHAATFTAFLEKELMPYIEKNYRTASPKTLIGESLGGLLAAGILLQQPALFSRYIIISPSLWWDGGSLLILPPASHYSPGTQVYIGVGKEGPTPGANPRVMEVDANLLAAKLMQPKNPNLTVFFDYLPDETHATIGHQAAQNAFKAFAGNGEKQE